MFPHMTFPKSAPSHRSLGKHKLGSCFLFRFFDQAVSLSCVGPILHPQSSPASIAANPPISWLDDLSRLLLCDLPGLRPDWRTHARRSADSYSHWL